MKHYYTIIWNNKYKNDELISWMDNKTYETKEDALNAAIETAHMLWDEMPGLSFMIFMHANKWYTTRED